jgi:presenilin-like A22 family membrane protease
MKHALKITSILIILFFTSQVVGLGVLNKYIDYEKTTPEQREKGNITWMALPFNIERPEVEESTSYIYIIIAILVGTGILLLLIKYRRVNWWKVWYGLAVLLCLTIAFKAFLNQYLSFVIALILTSLKMFRPSIIIHNLGEVFIYAGLAAIFVPIINLIGIFVLLALISAYDMYAVWKSKHMVKMAKFLTKTKAFAGMAIPYKLPKKVKAKKKLGKVETAVLGGGDIGFPLIFAGVVMKSYGFWNSVIVAIFVTIALTSLLILAKKEKFYPAMPFLSIGCLAGFLFINLF